MLELLFIILPNDTFSNLMLRSMTINQLISFVYDYIIKFTFL